ncbi:MAG: BspA family leucine-rich repeat surface protein [Lachnospiraceae bacterium]|nr:BspA family leucine-rich repeat surface protein [Lachnospiraceae bacterium]
MHRWFSGVEDGALTGLENLNTSTVTDMSLMFLNSALTSIDVSTFDVLNVTDFSDMFSGCVNLTPKN